MHRFSIILFSSYNGDYFSRHNRGKLQQNDWQEVTDIVNSRQNKNRRPVQESDQHVEEKMQGGMN